MAPMFDKNDIQVGEYDPRVGGHLLRVQRDGRDIYFVYVAKEGVYVERVCLTVEVVLTTD